MIRASSAIPGFYRPGVDIDGVNYFDGGVSDAIPVREAMARVSDALASIAQAVALAASVTLLTGFTVLLGAAAAAGVAAGAGLGLSIVHKILEQHNASVEVESEEGKGTTFTLKFPMKRSEGSRCIAIKF